MKRGVLTFFCGKMGAGKSTKAQEIAHKTNAVLLTEDEWLGALYPNKIASLEDYLKYANRLKPQMKKLAQSILLAGTDVVMDFPANTPRQRQWFKKIFTELKASHNLIYLDVSDEICLKQIEARKIEQPERKLTDTAEMFEQVTKYFVEPVQEEGFVVNKMIQSYHKYEERS